MEITYFGHSKFLLTSEAGVRVVTDPYDQTVNQSRVIEADAVTSSHNHFDHNFISLVKGNPLVFNGLDDLGDWVSIRETLKDTVISTVVGTYHDRSQGEERGKNTIFIIEMKGLKIGHLGDLGHELREEKILNQLLDIDVLLIPVGGFYTINAQEALATIKQLRPKIAIPMHFKMESTKEWPIEKLEAFTNYVQPITAIEGAARITRERLPAPTAIWVLQPRA